MSRSDRYEPPWFIDSEERVGRFTDAERDRHDERLVHKARGGAPLMGGERAAGRWEPRCRCGWAEFSNSGKADAERAWRDHRHAAVLEDRAIERGEPIYRVVVARAWERRPDLEPEDVHQWRAVFTEERARELHAEVAPIEGRFPRIERSTDGKTWEALPDGQ